MKKNILLVDDKSEFRALVQIFLSRKFNVESCANGLEAINLLESGLSPDIIVSDLNMPDFDGWSLLKQLKTSGLYKNIPVVIVSSIDKSADKVELIRNGAEDYIVKPFSPQELEIRIERILKVV